MSFIMKIVAALLFFGVFLPCFYLECKGEVIRTFVLSRCLKVLPLQLENMLIQKETCSNVTNFSQLAWLSFSQRLGCLLFSSFVCKDIYIKCPERRSLFFFNFIVVISTFKLVELMSKLTCTWCWNLDLKIASCRKLAHKIKLISLQQ